MELNKPNDIFVINSLAPDISANDLIHSDIISDNTSFFDKETYKTTDFAQNTFKNEEGVFDEVKFNDAYNKASKLYTEISNDKFLKNNLEWDAFDLTRPMNAKVKQRNIEIEKDINPYKSLYGRTSLDSVDQGDLSIRELAQQSKIFDTKLGEFRDESANDLGLFGSWFDDTLVYAQYDDEGYHLDDITGKQVKHNKGEYKLNSEGSFFIETLGDRNIAGKQVVNPTDLITTEGSAFNKVDFFDSDGREKSIVGTTFKLVTEIAPFLIPGFNTYYGGFKMATGLASVLPTFYKSLEGILLGDSTEGNETTLWKAATKTQGFLAKYNAKSFSDESANSMWNYEQLGDMVASTLSQVYEQRAAAKLATLFYKSNNTEYLGKLSQIAEKELAKGAIGGAITDKSSKKFAALAANKIGEIAKVGEKQGKLAKTLSLGYMAMTQSADIYQSALDGGYDRRTAGLASLVAAGGQYGIMMNNRMGDWFLDKSVGYNLESSRAGIKKAVNEFLPDLEKGIVAMDVKGKVAKKGLAKVIGKMKAGINKVLVDPITSSEASEALWKNSIVEGIEEMTEQAVMDATKGMVDVMGWLGMTKNKGSFNTVENVFSKKGLETYLANMFGGFVGGGIFEVNRLKIEPFITGKAVDQETNYSLIRQISNGKADELKAEIDRRASAMGNTELTVAEDGAAATQDDDSQASIIAASGKKYIDHLDNILNSENLKETDEDIIKKTILDEVRISDLEKTNIHKWILSDFNKVASDIVVIRDQIARLEEVKEGENIKKSEDSQQLTKLNEELKNKREEARELLEGEKADYYKGLTTFALNRDLHAPFTSLNVVDYTKQTYDENFYELPVNTGTVNQESVTGEFEAIANDEGDIKNKMKFMYTAFNEVNKAFSTQIGEYAEEKHSKLRDKYVNILTDSRILSQETVSAVQPELKKSGLAAYNLEETLNFELGTSLLENGYLDTSGLNDEEVEVVKNTLNAVKTVPYRDLSPEFISKIDFGEVGKIEELNAKVAEEAEKSGISIEEATVMYADEYEVIRKATPRLKNPDSTEILPLDIIYLTDAIKEDSEIPIEVSDTIKRRLAPKVEKVKKSIRDIIVDMDAFEGVAMINPDVDVDLDEGEQVVANIGAIKEKAIASNTLTELNEVIKELQTYIEAIKDESIKNIMKTEILTISPIDSIYLKTEKSIEGKEVLDNKLLDLLGNMQVEVYSEKGLNTSNVLNILKDELQAFKIADTPQEYVRSKDSVDAMKKAKEVIGLAKSINAAMVDTSVDATNPYGFNVSMRNSMEKQERPGEVDKYKVIDAASYHLLNKELNTIENKLNFLIELSEANKSTIAVVQEEIRNNTQGLLLKTLTNVDNKISIINLEVNGEKLVDPKAVSDIMARDLTDEKKLLEIEELIYNSFKPFYLENKEESLNQLFEAFNNDDFKKEVEFYVDSGFVRGLKSINTVNYFDYLHTLLAVNSKKFYANYKNLLEKEVSLESNRKAPFFGQEFSIRAVYAYRANKKVMQHAMDFKQRLMDDGRMGLNSSMFITGSGGVGKTNVISNFLWRIDSRENTRAVVAAPSTKQLEKLKKDISREKSENVTSSTKEDIMKKLLGDNYEAFKEALESLSTKSKSKDSMNNISITDKNDNPIIKIGSFGKYEFSFHEDFLNKITFPLSKDYDTVLYVDEVSWFSPMELSIIDYIASMNGSTLYLVGLGDELQNGHSLNDDTPFSLDTFRNNRPPKLKSVIRAENIHKQSNTESLEISLKSRLANIVTRSAIEPITLNYNDNEFLDGDRVIGELNVADLKKLNPEQEIAVITDDGTLTDDQRQTFTNAELPIDKLIILAKNNIQGNEFDQVVSLFDIKYNKVNPLSLYNANKQLYTLLSRGKRNTLIIGNGQLLKDLEITPERKDTTSSVKLEMGQINDLLEKRLEDLSDIEYVDEGEDLGTKVSEIEVEAEFHEKATPVVENDMGDNMEDERIKKTQADYDGDHTYLTYSFYNMLNAKLEDSELEVNELEVSEIEEGTMSDLQFLDEVRPSVKDSMTPQELINEFIIAKNHLLHGREIPSNIFKKAFDKFADGKLVVRKVAINAYTEPYGKQVHMVDKSGKERIGTKDQLFLALKTTFNKDGVSTDGYITLAAMPDLENKNWTQEQNKEFLILLDNKLKGKKDIEIAANINPLTGIRTIFSTGTSKKGGEVISITGKDITEFKKNLIGSMPGLVTTDLKTLRVFDDNEANIKKEFSETGYKLDTEKPGLEDAKPFRFRPFIKVSYIDAKDNTVSKLMIFQTKKRSLLSAKKEYDRIKQEYEDNKGNNVLREQYRDVEFPALIAKWNGVILLTDILKFYENDKEFDSQTNSMKSKAEIILDKILMMNLVAADAIDGSQIKAVETFEKMVNIIKKSEYDTSNISKEDRKTLLGGIKGATRISNLGLRILDILTEAEIQEFSEFYESKNGQYNVYYNPLWKSLHKDGYYEKKMDSKFIKYLELNAYLEPPIFKLKLNKVIDESVEEIEDVPEKVIETAETETVEDLPILKRKTYLSPFIMNGQQRPIKIDLEGLDTDKRAHTTIAAIDEALNSIKVKLNTIEDSEIAESMQNLLLSTIPAIIGNKTLFSDSGKINTAAVNLNYKTIVKTSEDFEAIDDYLAEKGEDAEDYFLTSFTVKSPIDINQENNKTLCK